MPRLIARAALAAALLSPCALPAATLPVGPGKPYPTVAAGIAAAQDGDTVAVQAGSYVNDFAEIRHRIALVAVGGRVVLRANIFIPNRKAILITDTDVSITGFSFAGARVRQADGGNGAGIRYQGGRLTLTDCYFVNNQEGLLGAADPSGIIAIARSEFAHNGVAAGASAGSTHNLYVGDIARLDIADSYFHDAVLGHQIKSRARATTIARTRVVDGPTGTGSYSIDLPNGGAATITASQIAQGPLSDNHAIISFGEEGGVYPGSALSVSDTLVENDLDAASVSVVRNLTSVTATLSGLRVFGLTPAQLAVGPVSVTGTILLGAEPAIPTLHPWRR